MRDMKTFHRVGIAVVLLGAALVRPALAGWTGLEVAGRPQDVQIWGPGSFTVATDRGAFQFDGGVQVGTLRAGENIRGTFLAADGCLCAVDNLVSTLSTSCGSEVEALSSGVLRMRHVGQGGAGYLLRNQVGNGEIRYFPQGADPRATDSVLVSSVLPPGQAIDAELVNGSTIGLIQLEGPTDNTYLLPAVNGGAGTAWTVNATGFTETIELVPSPAGLHYFLASAKALYRGQSPDGGGAWTQPVGIWAPPSGLTVRGVAIDGRGGAPGGAYGHGVMVLGDGGTDRVYRPVPVFDGGTPGSTWEATEVGVDPGGAPFALAECLGAHTCVLARPVGSGVNLALYRNEAPPAAVLEAQPSTVREGESGFVALTSLVDPDGDPVALRWSVSAPRGTPPELLVDLDGRAVRFDTTGLQVCEPERQLSIRVEVSDGLAAHERNVVAPVIVERSARPLIVPATGTVEVGGAPIELTVDPASFAACAPTGHRWRLTGAGELASDGGPVATLTASPVACDQEPGVLSVEVEAIAPAGDVTSQPATFQVVRPVIPIGEASLELQIDEVVSGLVRGTLRTDVDCPSAQGFAAAVSILQDGVELDLPVLLPADGAFELPIPGGCNAGTFTVRAVLQDAAGGLGAVVEEGFVTEATPVRVGALEETQVVARCVEGISQSLTLTPPADACLGATWTWTQVSGPVVSPSPQQGRTIRLQSGDGVPLEGLIGQVLEFEVRADAGGGNEDVQRVSVTVGSELLVDVSGALESPLVPESGKTAARLALRNRTACELSGLELRAELEGARPVLTSVEAGGQAVTQVTWAEGRLTVPELQTGSSDTAEVTFLVQPGLAASDVSLAGEVWLNGVRVSEPARHQTSNGAPESCGCRGGPGAPMGLLSLLVLRAFRRRRARA